MLFYKFVLIFYVLFLVANIAHADETHVNNYVCNETEEEHVYTCVGMDTGDVVTCKVNDDLKFDCE